MRLWGLVAGNPWLVVGIAALIGGLLFGLYQTGYSKGHKHATDAANTEKLAIERASTKALLEANARAAASDARFAKIQQDTEKRHHENQLAIDDERKRLAAAGRLRDPGYRPANCRGLPQNTEAASDTTDTPAPGELSEEFTAFLRNEAYEADKVSVYAKTCHEWATGIQGVGE